MGKFAGKCGPPVLPIPLTRLQPACRSGKTPQARLANTFIARPSPKDGAIFWLAYEFLKVETFRFGPDRFAVQRRNSSMNTIRHVEYPYGSAYLSDGPEAAKLCEGSLIYFEVAEGTEIDPAAFTHQYVDANGNKPR